MTLPSASAASTPIVPTAADGPGFPAGAWHDPTLTGWRRLPMHPLQHNGTEAGVARLELDGRWAFELFRCPQDALALPADTPPGSELAVPGCWTLQDFDDLHGVADLPHYTNVQMPWPDLPPRPPAANPTGVYQREVSLPVDWAGRRVVLHVGAAESVLYAQLNGVPVGIGKDSHLASEFDVTAVVRPGEANTVRLTVVKWSDASFIEDQDQWWHGGVTRSTFLYTTGPVYLADVRVQAGLARRQAADGDDAGHPGHADHPAWPRYVQPDGSARRWSRSASPAAPRCRGRRRSTPARSRTVSDGPARCRSARWQRCGRCT
jgi:beta-galactosidase